MWLIMVDTGHEEADAKGTSHVGLRGPLVLIGQIGHELMRWNGISVNVLVIEALAAHVLGECAGICGETGNAAANVVVNLEELLLVR
jgi:hypothetical protein